VGGLEKLALVEVTLKGLEVFVRPEVWLSGAGPYDPITGELGKDYRALVLYKNPHLTASCVRWDPARELANFVASFDWTCGLRNPESLDAARSRPSLLEMVLCRKPDCPSRRELDWRRLQLAWLQAVSNDLLSIHLSGDERKAEIAFCYGRCVVIVFLHFLDLAQASGVALARRVVSEFPGFVELLAPLIAPTQQGIAGVKYPLDVEALLGAGPAPAVTPPATTKKGSPTGRK
jgi:hypothetical protein